MRLKILMISSFLFIQACNKKHSEKDRATIQFIQELVDQLEFKQNNNQMPPPPPELKDQPIPKKVDKQTGVTLKLYIDPNIKYRKIIDQKLVTSRGFNFVAKSTENKDGDVLDLSSLETPKTVQLIPISNEEFMQKVNNISFEEGYEGLVTIHNLYVSKEQDRCYFEYSHFMRKLNSGTAAVFGTRNEDGTWVFETVELGFS